jgi:hypothetical protein
MSDFRAWASRVRQLDRALTDLAPRAEAIGVDLPAGRDWFDLLRLKLMPQLDAAPFLVVGIVGGTNIGKSLLFNHLAGEVASAVSPLAAGTKHPVCLVPPGFSDPSELGRIFEGFRLVPWQSADDPLQESEENLLFWRIGGNVPPRLMLLDAPDVDSDALVNWQRARAIRQVADVLVAVLTQQKYNDAAVKQFFREAVQADKPIVAVFNQCDVEGDRDYWPLWLETFSSETGAKPELVYVVPLDRAAAREWKLPFYEVGRNGRRPLAAASVLRDELAALHFDAIKIRTFRGALGRVLDPAQGAPAWLAHIRAASEQFAAAHRALSAAEIARVAWPSLPTGVLVDEIRQWWDVARSPWSRSIHGFYRTLGQGVTWPIRKAMQFAGPPLDPLDAFHKREREAILLAVEKMLDELERLAQVGNETLRPRLLELLGGTARERLLVRVEAAHHDLPAVDEDYRRFLRAELDGWKESSPGAVRFLRSLDHIAAVARPAITVGFFVLGLHAAGDLAGQAATHAIGVTAGQFAQEAAITGGITGGGEALVSGASEGIRQSAGRLFLRIQTRFAQQRAAWLAGWLEEELLGYLLCELRRGAETPQSEPFRAAEEILAEMAGAGEPAGK